MGNDTPQAPQGPQPPGDLIYGCCVRGQRTYDGKPNGWACPAVCADPNSPECTGHMRTACVTNGGFEIGVPRCKLWAGANMNQPEVQNTLARVCTGARMLNPDDVCNDFASTATGAYANACRASVTKYCQTHMGDAACQQYARGMKRGGYDALDPAVAEYCAAKPTDPFCACMVSPMPLAHCFDLKCTNSTIAYPSSTAPCSGINVTMCKQAVDVAGSSDVEVDKAKLQQVCGGVVNESMWSVLSDSGYLGILLLVLVLVVIAVAGAFTWKIMHGTYGSVPP